jgi:Ca-activated chloride channel family protein
MSWANPEWLWGLILIPILLGLEIWRGWKHRRPGLLFSNTDWLQDLPGNWRSYGVWLAPLFYIGATALLILAMARPQYENTTVERNAEGIDIVMALDISTSMRAEDLEPNRFEAARNVATDFIDKRISDRIGLVAFARQSFTVCPPTLDYRLLKELLSDVEMGMIQDGTAIGMGLATCVNRLKESEAKSKVIILLTDGENNAGEIDPVTAAELAETYGIKIYSIGAGTRGTAPYPIQDPIFGKRYQNVRVDIDEEMLTEIAQMTGGEYFRATDTQRLKDIYDRINELEKTKIEEIIYTDYQDLYARFLIPAIALIILGMLCEFTIFRVRVA